LVGSLDPTHARRVKSPRRRDWTVEVLEKDAVDVRRVPFRPVRQKPLEDTVELWCRPEGERLALGPSAGARDGSRDGPVTE